MIKYAMKTIGKKQRPTYKLPDFHVGVQFKMLVGIKSNFKNSIDVVVKKSMNQKHIVLAWWGFAVFRI